MVGPNHSKLLPLGPQLESTKKLKKYRFNAKRRARKKLQSLDKEFEEFMNAQLSFSTSNGQINREDEDSTLKLMLEEKDRNDVDMRVLQIK